MRRSLEHTRDAVAAYGPILQSRCRLNFSDASLDNWRAEYPSVDIDTLSSVEGEVLGVSEGTSATLLLDSSGVVRFVARGLLSGDNKRQLLERFVPGAKGLAARDHSSSRRFFVGRPLPSMKVGSSSSDGRAKRLAMLPGSTLLIVYVPSGCSHCRLQSLERELGKIRDMADTAGHELAYPVDEVETDGDALSALLGNEATILTFEDGSERRLPTRAEEAEPRLVWCQDGLVTGIHEVRHLDEILQIR